MPDAIAQVNELKGLPDQALQSELVNPSGAVPAYLVLAEAQRRQLMRQSAVTSQNQAPVGSVYDDVIRDMMARQPPPGAAPAGATPPASAPPSAPQTPQNFRPPQGMAEGGEVDDDDNGDDDDSDIVEMPLNAPLKPAGPFRAVAAKPAGLPQSKRKASAADYDDEVEAAGQHYSVDPNLTRAVMGVESEGKPGLVSPKGAMGLMQLMPDTAAGMGVTDPQDPHQNIWGGTRYLREMIDRYGGDIPRALAAYNAGPGRVKPGGEIPLYAQSYVNGVMKRYSKLGSASAPAAAEEAREPDGPLTPPTPTRAFLSPDDWRDSLQAPDAAPPGTSELAANPELARLLASGSPSPAMPAAAPGAVSAPAAQAASANPFDPKALADSRDVYQGVYYGSQVPLTADQKALRDHIQKMWDEAEARKKPNFWQYLENFGLGMATTPSRNWAQSIAGGAAGMVKGIGAQQEEARKQELDLLGVSSKLDDQMRVEQGKIGDAVTAQARIQQQALNEAAQKKLAEQDKSFDDLRRAPDARYGRQDQQPALDFTFTPDPHTPGLGIWSPPGTRKVTPDLLPFVRTMGLNEQTGKPFEAGDIAPYSYITAAQKKALETQASKEKHIQSQAEFNTAYGVANTLRTHPEIPWPVDADGQPRDPSSLRLNDLPNTPQLQSEGLWRARIAREQWSPALAKAIIADPYAPPDLAAQAKNIQAQDVSQTGQLAAERTKQNELAKTAQQQQQAAVLSATGQKTMGSIDPVGRSVDSLISILGQPQYYADRNPLTIAKPWALYRAGIGSGGDADDINRNMGNLALTTVRAAMPYATASRNMKWIDMVLTHLPNPPFDSPANMRDKLINARLGLLGIEASTLRWERKNAGATDPGPTITPDRAQVYLQLAAGGRDIHSLSKDEQAKAYKQAMKWAVDAGWTIPQ